MIERCLYVSISKLDGSTAELEVENIVKRSLLSNRGLEITGSMIFTGIYFAQVIEGPLTSLEYLMGRITNDPRHTALRVISRNNDTVRKFNDWQMAYSGPATYVSNYVSPLIGEIVDGHDKDVAGSRLLNLMREFYRHRHIS